MNKKKTIFISLILMAIFLLAGCGSGKEYPVANGDAKLIFFFGETCPHCKIVEEYFEKNNVEEKIDFEMAEVYTVKENAEILKNKAEICAIPLDQLGVPLLWNDGQCISGDKDIISFFEKQLKK